jgi:putative FmdB family regulatory protein
MKRSDYVCKDCGSVFEIWVKGKLTNFPVNPICSACGKTNTQRKYSNIIFDVSEGHLGNSKSKYETNITSHPSSLVGKVKGKRIK